MNTIQNEINNKTMKIAILITVYKNENQLNNLIEHLSKDFDIYIHADKRSSVYVKKSSKVSIYREYKSYWGSFNTVLAVLLLLKEASEKNYDRYIQITGQDLPIKSNKFIIDFFEKHRNVEFIEYFKLPSENWKNGGIDRIRKYWGKEPSRLFGYEKHIAILTKIGLALIYKMPVAFLFYREIQYQFYGGSNYMDLTNHCVKKILKFLEGNPEYLNRFKYTYIPEEIFFHTIIMNLKLDTIIENRVLRFVDWKNGPDYPKTLTIDDYQRVMNSENIFARKFDENKDNEIIRRIYQYVT